MKAEAESFPSAFVYFYKCGSDIIIFLSENANIEKFESEKMKHTAKALREGTKLIVVTVGLADPQDERNAENLLQQKSKCATIDEVRRR